MQINIALTPAQNLLAILNSSNAASITESQVTFGLPQVAATEDLDDNTTVTVSAVPLAGFTGTVDVTYRRLRLDTCVLTPAHNFIADNTKTLAEVKTMIATAYNILESEFELVATIPTTFGEITNGTIVSDVDSLIYVGTVNITLEWSATLASAITTTNLTGFSPAA